MSVVPLLHEDRIGMIAQDCVAKNMELSSNAECGVTSTTQPGQVLSDDIAVCKGLIAIRPNVVALGKRLTLATTLSAM